MTSDSHPHEPLDDLRTLNIFREARERYADVWSDDYDLASKETQAVCNAILIAADILRRTVIAAHDAQFEATHYDP